MNYEQWKQLADKMEPKLRPVTCELIQTCIQQEFCDNCRMRCGCPYRLKFYMDDLHYEIDLQSAEVRTLDIIQTILSNTTPEEITLKITNDFRRRRHHELERYHYYSFV